MFQCRNYYDYFRNEKDYDRYRQDWNTQNIKQRTSFCFIMMAYNLTVIN